MTTHKINEILQWTGTLFVLAMYAVMNLAPEQTTLTQLLALVGALAFFTWTVRVGNRPQQLINTVAILLCVLGLAKGLV